jgi:hypothetical protein
MESVPADELATLTRLQSTTRREVVRTPRWVLPVIAVSIALFFLAYAVRIPGIDRFGWIIWIAYVWGVVVLARRPNRAKAPGELWRLLAVMIAIFAGGFVLAEIVNNVVGGIVAGTAGIAFGALSARRERRR